MTGQIILEAHGEAACMQYVDSTLTAPKAGEIRIRHTAIGVNFIDIYHRKGLYPLSLPSGLGMEAAGVVEAIGDGVTGFSIGQRVAYAYPPIGAYAQARNFPAERLVHIPPNVSDDQAAAGLLKGLTAWYLLKRCFAVTTGSHVLIYAAAGGVGQILSRWASHLGAHVYGIVGNEEKREQALWAGCDEVFLDSDDYVNELQKRGRVEVVYDSVGADSFMRSLDCLRPLGTMVSFGNASGPIPAFEPALLGWKGSLTFTRPTLMDHMADHDTLQTAARDVFALIEENILQIKVGQSYALADAAIAHQDLEQRKTVASSLLYP